MSYKYPIKLHDASRHPPGLSPVVDDVEIPWVLIERKAYVADLNNDTTATLVSSCGKEIQVTLNAVRPPSVSYLCIYCRCHTEKDQEMIPIEPEIIASDGDLLLLRIVVSPEKDILSGADLYIYRLAGTGGPLLTRLQRPPSDFYINSFKVGLLCCSAKRPDDLEDQFYMVAALCDEGYRLGRGHFILYLYSSILGTWTTTTVSLEDKQLQQHQEEGCFIHVNTKVIAVGGEGNTMGFVDLWRGILLCNLNEGEVSPTLSYIPLPQPPQLDEMLMADPCLWRDIVVVKGCIKFVHQQLRWRLLSDYSGRYTKDDWVATMWTRPVAASTSQMLDHTWEKVCCIDSSKIDRDNNLPFDLIPKVEDDEGRLLSPFKSLVVNRPTLSLDGDGDTVCFMVKFSYSADNAWMFAIDMREKEIQILVEFAEDRYSYGGFACLQSRISKCLKWVTDDDPDIDLNGMVPMGGRGLSTMQDQPHNLCISKLLPFQGINQTP